MSPSSPLPARREGSATIARAQALVGTRFRSHGRNPATGLDCVGLAGLAMGVEGLPTGYALRGGSAGAVAHRIDSTGLTRCDPTPGALALVESGPDQLHLLILTAEGFIHADAARRRVVERRGEIPWPVLGCWQRSASPPFQGGD